MEVSDVQIISSANDPVIFRICAEKTKPVIAAVIKEIEERCLEELADKILDSDQAQESINQLDEDQAIIIRPIHTSCDFGLVLA